MERCNGLKKNKILCVDDDQNLLEAMRRSLLLLRPEWQIALATDPRRAQEIIVAENFDVLVSDISMPHVSGVDLARHVRAGSPNTKIIMLTGIADLDVAITAINDVDVFRFYTKPCPAEELVKAIDTALAVDTSDAGFEIRSQTGEAALSRLPTGVIVVEQSGRAVFMNARGAEIVAAKDGLSISTNNTLCADLDQDTKNLRNLIEEVLTGSGCQSRALALSRPSLSRPYAILISRVEDHPTADRALLFVSDPERQLDISVDVVEKLLGLTRSEARLACALARGTELAVAAQSMGVTLSTARTYLKVIFSKTGTNRQAELVRLILMSPAIIDAN